MFIWGTITGAGIMFVGVLLGVVVSAIRSETESNKNIRFSSKEDKR